ncbi:restriction endonuclease [Sphingomonas sp. IC4-52]|uniref:restriction endonuclease n=1 Tax=Sphingomonas sp. IC4-52 TaxID=2887202 RepID=UPI001D13051E|nr:restriction endonuclease [Sphingomonas sp. IC4-52]MCC2980796.1 restriction endonuclease [Sphingomonas sp. IC4-52]
MNQITPSTIRYIKPGAGGGWESALDRGRLEWGTGGDSHLAALNGDWRAVTQAYIAQGRLPATATGYTNEARAFFDADPGTMWITFARGRMWWCFAEPEVHATADDDATDAAFYRVAHGGWSDRDVNGIVLDADRLSTRLSQLQSYRRTICGLTKEQETLCRSYINAVPDPVQAAIAAARDELKQHLRSLIQRLTWRDFEQFIDLALARTGWIRVSSLGGTTKDVDLVVEQSFTRERMSVQVKSKANQRMVDDYARRLGARTAGERIMLICHSPEGDLAAPPSTNGRRLELVLDGEVAELSINAGLVDWVIARAH